jgi:hypothetical protein
VKPQSAGFIEERVLGGDLLVAFIEAEVLFDFGDPRKQVIDLFGEAGVTSICRRALLGVTRS